uniref:Uncharacterized protein n=1 Tax=Cyprinus carpio carpio TaxID=630221 RepID=A0A9J8CL42_CYPCA
MVSSGFVFLKAIVSQWRTSFYSNKQRPPLTGPNLSSLNLTPPAPASAFLSPCAGPTGAPSPPPRASIQLSDHSVKARDPLTPQPPAYPV